MYIFDIRGLLDNTATIYTKIEILPKVAGESIITLTNENSVKSWVYSDLRNVEKQGFIGQFVARTLDGELQDISDDFNIEDREIVLYLGIDSNHTSEIVTENNVVITDQTGAEEFITEQGEDQLTYYKLGNFFVEKPDSDEVRDSTKFKSMDYTILFNATFNANYKDSEYTKSFNEKMADSESVTALWLAQYTCKQVGVELATTTFRNSDFAITSNQFDSGYTCRDVIKSIAKLAVTWARIGWNNKLYLDFNKVTDSPEEYNIITNDNYYNLTTQKDVYGEVNRILMGSSVVVGNSAYIENAQSIEDNGLTELDVYDNPILYTQELREQAITGATPMLGLMYQPVEIETTGHPWLLGNELITVVDMEGNHLNTYPLDRVLTYNGHIRSKINSMTKTEMESTYAYQGVENDDTEIKRSRVELDRQNQTLTSLLERTTSTESQISSITQNLDGVNVNVTNISGDVSALQGNISTITGNITNINGDISSINSSLGSITGNVSTLQGNVSNINDDIQGINGNIRTLNSNIVTLSSNLNGLSADFDDFYDNEYVQTIENLQDQIDGVIEFWTGSDIPTLNNAPASSWTTEALKQEHIGDVYTIISGQAQGAEYRFIKDGNTWKWLEISDSQIGAVRELAESAMAKATTNESNISTLNGNVSSINSEVQTAKQNILALNSDVVDLQATDVSLQTSIDGISANYSTLSNHVDTLDTDVDGLKTGYNAITTAQKTVVGNPITIFDCGEYLINNLTLYGNTFQDGNPTPSNPVNVQNVTGEHTFNVYSKNLLNIGDATKTQGTYLTIKADNGVLIWNGQTSNVAVGFNFNEEITTLPAGSYKVSYETEGYSSNVNVPSISLGVNGSTTTLSFTKTSATTGDANLLLNTVSDCYIKITTQASTIYEDYKLKIQIEKGTEATKYSSFVLPQSYTYDLRNIELSGIDDYKDYVFYDINTESWYQYKVTTKKHLSDIVQTNGSSDTNNIVFKAYDTNISGFGTTFPILADDIPCFSNYFKWGGKVSDDAEALSNGVGMYTNYKNINGTYGGVLYVVVPKSIATQLNTFKTWCDNNNVNVWFVHNETITPELLEDNISYELNNILETAKLYKTDMVVEDIPSSNIKGDIEVNYLTDTIFNAIYASRSALKVAQNSISTTVSETVSAVIEPLDNRVTSISNSLDQTTNDLNNSINVLNENLNEYAKQSSLVSVTNTVENIQTSLNEQILVTRKIQEDGVEKVTTTTGFTFDETGLTIDKTGADTKTVVDEDGMTVYSKTGSENSILLNVDSQGVQTENLHVRTYTQIGSHTRMQDYEDGTAIFYIE